MIVPHLKLRQGYFLFDDIPASHHVPSHWADNVSGLILIEGRGDRCRMIFDDRPQDEMIIRTPMMLADVLD